MITPQEFFNLLSDETRLRCLLLLQKEKELCVCELGQILESIQPKISRHLSLLRLSGLVLDKRKGQWVYYRLNEEMPDWMQQILVCTFNQFQEQEPFFTDLEKSSKLCDNDVCIT